MLPQSTTRSMCDYLCHNKLYFVITACGCGLLQQAFNKIMFCSGIDNLYGFFLQIVRIFGHDLIITSVHLFVGIRDDCSTPNN